LKINEEVSNLLNKKLISNFDKFIERIDIITAMESIKVIIY
jgi:hypothetical protein